MTNTTLLGRALFPVPTTNQRVLVVTSPTLVYALMREVRTEPSDIELLTSELVIGIMDAVQANPQKGVFSGTLLQVDHRPLESGLFRVDARIDPDTAPLIETECVITATIHPADRQTQATMPPVLIDPDNEGLLGPLSDLMSLNSVTFERDHPWFTRIGWSADTRTTILKRLSNDSLGQMLMSMDNDTAASVFKSDPELLKLWLADSKGALPLDESIKLAKRAVTVLRHFLTKKECERYYFVLPEEPASRMRLQRLLDRFIAKAKTSNMKR